MRRAAMSAPANGFRYFFYGTLLDRDVQSVVIGRHIGRRDMTPAIIRDHRRVYVADAWYPTLVPSDGTDVPGYIVGGLTPRERRWIDQFEDDDYVLTDVPVASRQGGTVIAAVYMPPGPEVASNRTWTLEEWRRRYKRHYIMRAKRWMVSDFDRNW